MPATITRAAAITAFQAIKKAAWPVYTGSTPLSPDIMLDDIAAASDAEIASNEAQTSLRSMLTMTRDAAVNRAAQLRRDGKSDPSTLHALRQADAVVAACNAALPA